MPVDRKTAELAIRHTLAVETFLTEGDSLGWRRNVWRYRNRERVYQQAREAGLSRLEIKAAELRGMVQGAGELGGFLLRTKGKYPLNRQWSKRK